MRRRARRGQGPAGGTSRPSRRPGFLALALDRKSTRLNSSHSQISYAVFCLKKKNLKPTEDDLLCALTRTAGTLLTPSRLLPRVLWPDFSGENPYLRSFVRPQRRTFAPDLAQ